MLSSIRSADALRSVFRRQTNGNFVDEVVWPSSGGGPSAYEVRPYYQSSISTIVGTQRGTPDVSALASNVSFYDSQLCKGKSGWQLAGGMSISTPIWAGIVNSAGVFYSSTTGQLSLFYSNLGNATIFTDITHGSAGGYPAQPGWDFASGIGTAVGYGGK
jgi:subtilase family serine protease